MAGGMAVSLIGLMTLRSDVGFWLLVAGNGLGGGIFGLLLSVTWPRFYGILHLGAISGFHRSWLVGFSAAGPLAFSLSLRHLGNYHAAAAGCLVLTIILGVAAVRADNPSAVNDA